MTQHQIEAMKLALEALKQIDEAMPFPVAKLAQKAIKEALAQPEQEPVAWPHKYGCRANAFGKCDMGCTTPPQRTWVGLTDLEIGTIAYNVNPLDGIRQFSRAIEAKLKEKNT